MNVNSLVSGAVYTFKFTSGEEMVARVVSYETSYNTIEVSAPVSIAPGPQGMGLVPSMFTADASKNITINSNSIAMYAETEDSVCMKYVEAVTGIKVPDKKIIMG